MILLSANLKALHLITKSPPQIREDDIFVVSFPKCGTTLTMELAWLLSHQAIYRLYHDITYPSTVYTATSPVNNLPNSPTQADTAAAAGPRGQRCAFLEGPGMLGGPDWRKQYDDLQMVGFGHHCNL